MLNQPTFKITWLNLLSNIRKLILDIISFIDLNEYKYKLNFYMLGFIDLDKKL
jgi:hypothetical protein